MNTLIIIFVFMGWIALIYVFGIVLETAEKKLKKIRVRLKESQINSINEKVQVR